MMSNLAEPLSQSDNTCNTTGSGVESWQPFKEEIQEEAQINLLEVKRVISSLSLTSVNVGHCLVVMRSEFDLSVSGEPYIALMLVLDLKSRKYISRVWNQTVATGSAVDEGKLMEACQNIFCQGRPCLGYHFADKPFPRKMASKCNKLLGNDAGIDETICQECSKIMPFPTEPCEVMKEEFDSDIESDNTNDVPERRKIGSDSINADEFEVGVDQEQEEMKDKPHIEKPHIEKPCVSKREPEDPSVKNEMNSLKECPFCGQTFGAKSSSFQKHLKRVHFYGAFKCRVCGYKAKFATDLIKHMDQNCSTHYPLASCPNCKQEVSFQEIHVHYEDCIGKAYMEYDKRRAAKRKNNATSICPTCGKTISGKMQALKRHMRVHMRKQGLNEEGAKTSLYYYCEKCGKKSATKDTLKVHMLNMHNQDPIACPKCDTKFAKYYQMRQHELKEHKPQFQCKHCEYQTYCKQLLRRHQVKHFEPSFKCGHCDKMLKTQKSLESHEREHTGERPFECNACGKGFKAMNTLRTHNKLVHKILTPRMIPIVKRTRNR